MDEETKSKLRAAGREDFIEMMEVKDAGYQGCMPNGNLVDRRKHPEAIPVRYNSLLGVPEPKPTKFDDPTVFPDQWNTLDASDDDWRGTETDE